MDTKEQCGCFSGNCMHEPNSCDCEATRTVRRNGRKYRVCERCSSLWAETKRKVEPSLGDHLAAMGASDDFVAWTKFHPYARDAWQSCWEPSWMLWWIGKWKNASHERIAMMAGELAVTVRSLLRKDGFARQVAKDHENNWVSWRLEYKNIERRVDDLRNRIANGAEAISTAEAMILSARSSRRCMYEASIKAERAASDWSDAAAAWILIDASELADLAKNEAAEIIRKYFQCPPPVG